MFKHKALPILALVVVLLLAGSMVALAEEPSVEQVIRGEVIAVRPLAGAIALRTTSAPSIMVYVNARTRYVIPGVSDPGLDDIKVGDQVAATGRWRTRSEFDAALIVVNVVVRPFEVSGKVKTIEAPTFTLETPDGDKKIWTNASTRFAITGIANPTLADVRIGDQAHVTGVIAAATTETNNEARLMALTVVIRRPIIRPVELSGEVTAVDLTASTLTLETRNGEKLIHTDSKTRFVVPGVVNPTLADVQVGDKALVTAVLTPSATTADAEAQLTALSVVIQRAVSRPVKIAGKVAAIDLAAKTFTLETSSGDLKTVATNDRTQFIITGVKRPTLADVRVGDQAVVTGRAEPTLTDPERILAHVVAIRRTLPRPARVKGAVEAIDLGHLSMTVTTEDGDKVVKWDENTRFCVPDVENASITDIAVGDKIMALGYLNEDGSLQAKIVALQDCSDSASDLSDLDLEDLESI